MSGSTSDEGSGEEYDRRRLQRQYQRTSGGDRPNTSRVPGRDRHAKKTEGRRPLGGTGAATAAPDWGESLWHCLPNLHLTSNSVPHRVYNTMG
jgi:hypothetical protein